ncbi:polyprenyl synthetase family protein [Actinoallomurus spadix]|uniref:Polyprenyl synthetase family protein n=1 Tax=Actinoallomurus spadix TaxID=79912 RepID=A0ABP3GSS4_9ACTN|nr:polyprenyl synthetase family protein [Actinoallomurus spadix]MCO5989039.1 polyprenyl synthetase family protein [Actinoallomurus spadix]
MPLDVSPYAGTGDAATAILSRWNSLTAPALRAAVETLHPWPARMAAYAFGWADRDGRPSGRGMAAGGKGLRPALVLLCAGAAGAPAESALAGAVAVELVHAFSLVHDDIMDGDERRRHRASVWHAFGVGPAVLTGDALLALAMATLARVPRPGAAVAMERLSATLIELVHGQAEDLAFEDRPWAGRDAVTVEEYVAMAEAKTGALLGCAAALGCLLGGGSPERADRIAVMGRQLGLAFQMTDDLLGIWGDPSVTGKLASSDLRRGKKTLPVLAALEAGTPAARRLGELLTAPLTAEGDLELVRDLIEDAGGRQRTRERATACLRRALDVLDAEGASGPAAEDLAVLSRFLVERAS